MLFVLLPYGAVTLVGVVRCAGKDKEGGEKISEEEEQVGQQKWVEAVTSCNTWSRLHVLMAILDTSIKWEKSAADAVSHQLILYFCDW